VKVEWSLYVGVPLASLNDLALLTQYLLDVLLIPEPAKVVGDEVQILTTIAPNDYHSFLVGHAAEVLYATKLADATSVMKLKLGLQAPNGGLPAADVAGRVLGCRDKITIITHLCSRDGNVKGAPP